MSAPRFVEIRPCEADPCGRIRIEFDDDLDILQISDENTLPEQVSNQDALNVKPIGTVGILPALIEACRVAP